MKKMLVTAALFAIAQAVFAQTPAAPPRHEIKPEAVRQLDSLFQYLEARKLYNGNILVAVGGKKVASAAIGYSNMQTKERLKESSAFELASVSKQFTAVGVLRLVDAGKLKLDQKLETIFPAFPYKGVTIRQLLNHTGGLPEYEDLMIENWDRKKIATNNDVIGTLTKLQPKVAFEPGTKWEYSNTGYAMLSAVIEKVSGKSYADYMQKEVFAPLNLKHTFVYMRRYAPKKVEGYAYGYVKGDNGYVLPDSVKKYDYVRYLDGISGDGTVNSTLDDMLIWNNAVRDQKLLSPGLWKEAITAAEVAGKSTDYGFGFMVTTHPERGKVLSHTGGWPGYSINNVLYLDKDVSLTYLGNAQQPTPIVQGIYNAVKNIVFDKPFTFPEPVKEKVVANVDKKIYERYIGTYFSVEMEGFEIEITTEDGHLYAQATGQSRFEIKPESDTMFFMPDAPIAMEFKAEAGSNATSMILHQNGDHEFKRRE